VDAPTPAKPIKIRRWLPYWAVFQADAQQTLSSWIYRIWVLVSVLAAAGCLTYALGFRQAGVVQSASHLMSDLLRLSVVGSVTLIIVLAAGSISSERGTMADSVLSRGISRYQYFLGKWHARLAVVVGTFFVMGLITMLASFLLLREELSWRGGLMGLAMSTAVLVMVITGGVTVSALFNSSLVAIVVAWIVLYATGFVLSLLPAQYPTPYRALASLPEILCGEYDMRQLSRLIGWSILASCSLAVIGLGYFSRRDV
jgi:ABC-type transport system involved in multi-copper enzyme maturation permease subunit